MASWTARQRKLRGVCGKLISGKGSFSDKQTEPMALGGKVLFQERWEEGSIIVKYSSTRSESEDPDEEEGGLAGGYSFRAT